MPSCTAPNPTHDFMLVDPLCCNDDRAGEIGPTFYFMTRHDLVLTNDRIGINPSGHSSGETQLHPFEFPSGNSTEMLLLAD
jgi:hypothetical protein